MLKAGVVQPASSSCGQTVIGWTRWQQQPIKHCNQYCIARHLDMACP